MKPPATGRPAWLASHLGDARGRGVRVAVIDSGFDRRTDSPAREVLPGRGFVDPRRELALGESDDDHDRLGHGTAIARLVLDLATAVEILPLRVFGGRLESSPTVIVAALDHAVSAGCAVINLSLGSTSAAARQPFFDACERARRAGSVVVSAVPAGVEDVFPGCFESVLGVTAGRFSNVHDFVATGGGRSDFVAEGSGRLPSGEQQVGSSFAAPRISALAALLRERFPSADPGQVRRLLDDLARASVRANRTAGRETEEEARAESS